MPLPAPTPVQQPAQPGKGPELMRRIWGGIDSTLDTVPWYFTLAGGVALGVWLSKKMR
jgi:hypothetical protein